MNASDFFSLDDPGSGDRARFRHLGAFGGIDLFDADFLRFRFAPHSHETPMLGLMLAGHKGFRSGGRTSLVGPGDLSLVNAGEVHTGGVVPDGGRLRYIALYPSAALMAAAGLRLAEFPRPSARQSPAFAALAAALMPAAEPLAAEAGLVELLAEVARFHGAVPPRAAGISAPAVARAIARIEAGLAEPIGLDQILRCRRHRPAASAAQFSRHHRPVGAGVAAPGPGPRRGGTAAPGRAAGRGCRRLRLRRPAAHDPGLPCPAGRHARRLSRRLRLTAATLADLCACTYPGVREGLAPRSCRRPGGPACKSG